MKEDILINLRDFINRFYLKTFQKELLALPIINQATTIEDDLQITGDDADIFLTELVKEFKLDAVDFKGEKYFGHETENSDIFFPVLRFLIGQKKWMPLPKNQREEMTIGHLIQCIENGKLV